MVARRLLPLLAVLGALVAPASALAHAQLEATSPERGALVATEPGSISFTFDEQVNGTDGAVRVFDTKGNRADDGAAYHPNGDGKTFAVHLRSGLPKGTYTATYRVVSADTHIVTGGFVFSIGARSATAGSTVGQLLAGQKTGRVTAYAFDVTRGVQYGSIGIGAGLLAFLLLVWLPLLRRQGGGTEAWEAASGAFAGRLRRALLLAAGAGLLSALVGIGLQASESAGVSLWRISGSVVGDVIGERFGTIWLAGAIAWLVLGLAALVVLAPRSARAPVLQKASLGADGAVLAPPGVSLPRLAPLLVPAVALLFLPALAGHASIQHPVWLFLPANLVHVSAMCLWLGGLTALLFCLPSATRTLEGADRTRLLSGALLRYSPIALGCVIALTTTGVIQALIQVDAWSELWNTPYGRAVLVKVGLILGLVGLGAVNRQRTLPQLETLAARGEMPGAAGLVLRRTLRTEVAAIAVVLVVTGALAGYAPAKTTATGPVQITSTVGPAQLSFDVDPATVGSNVMHIYLLDPRSGAQYDRVKELTVTAALPAKGIGPLDLQVQNTGPGHWTIPSAVLGAPGTWTIDLTARVSDFDQYERKVQVRIR